MSMRSGKKRFSVGLSCIKIRFFKLKLLWVAKNVYLNALYWATNSLVSRSRANRGQQRIVVVLMLTLFFAFGPKTGAV